LDDAPPYDSINVLRDENVVRIRVGIEFTVGKKGFSNLGSMHIFGKPSISGIRKHTNQA
jgi:hypothetical protein